MTWATPEEVSLTWENRHQNYGVVSACEALRGSCNDILVMTSPGGWLELEEPPVFTKDGRRFAMALSANGYKQVRLLFDAASVHFETLFRLMLLTETQTKGSPLKVERWL